MEGGMEGRREGRKKGRREGNGTVYWPNKTRFSIRFGIMVC